MSELEFAQNYRNAVDRYLRAVDAWERKHGYTGRVHTAALSADLAEEEREYREARRELEKLSPRARILFTRFSIPEPYHTLLQVQLGVPGRMGSAIGGNERTQVAKSLVDLLAACAQDTTPVVDPRASKPKGLLGMIRNLFF
jgi:hypothetical protein